MPSKVIPESPDMLHALRPDATLPEIVWLAKRLPAWLEAQGLALEERLGRAPVDGDEFLIRDIERAREIMRTCYDPLPSQQ